jgi:hypothetical protein
MNHQYSRTPLTVAKATTVYGVNFRAKKNPSKPTTIFIIQTPQISPPNTKPPPLAAKQNPQISSPNTKPPPLWQLSKTNKIWKSYQIHVFHCPPIAIAPPATTGRRCHLQWFRSKVWRESGSTDLRSKESVSLLTWELMRLGRWKAAIGSSKMSSPTMRSARSRRRGGSTWKEGLHSLITLKASPWKYLPSFLL